jgi:predicted dehydrogenase
MLRMIRSTALERNSTPDVLDTLPMTQSRLGVGIIGMGRHGMRYAKHLIEDFPKARLAGFTRRDLDQAATQAKELGAPAYRDHRELLAAPDVDAVVVVVPPIFHPDIMKTAAERGKSVLLEKPAAINLEQGRAIQDAVQKSGIPVMVAQTMRYNETVVTIRKELPRVGRLHSIRLSQRFEQSPTAWIYDQSAGGGTMLHTGVHAFDLLRFMTGQEGVRISAEIGTAVRGPFEDNFSAVVELSDNSIGTVSGSRATSGRTGALEVVGDKGQIVADHVLRTAVFINGAGVTPIPLPPLAPTVALVLRDFVDAVVRRTPMPITLDDGLRAVALVEAAYTAARSGCAVSVSSL